MRQPARSFWLSGLVTLCCLAAIGVSTISPTHASPPPYIPQPQMLINLNTASNSSEPTYLTEFNGQVYFQANDGQHGYEIWRSDGTPDGTALFVDIIDGPGSTNPSKFTVVGSQMFFDAYSFEGPSLWITDGTPEGTRLVKDINARSDGSGPYYMTEFDGRLCFIFDSTYWSNSELWCSDGTADGTVLIKDVQPGTDEIETFPYGQKNGIVLAGSLMYVAADDGVNGIELWRVAAPDSFTQFLPIFGN